MTDLPAIPAATLVVLRAIDGAAPELLMVERAPTLAFAGGALVFPGGRVDAGDRRLAAAIGGEPDDAAARIAAIRETIEEAGVPIGLAPMPDPAALTALRASLLAGEADLGDALAAIGVALDPAALTPFARWRPANHPTRRFDTRFYLARLPAGAPEASVDGAENTRLVWATARDMLASVDAGHASVIFPTRRNLDRLARFATIEQAYADAAAWPIRTVTPWVEERGGVECLCIPDDLGYPITAEPLASVIRR